MSLGFSKSQIALAVATALGATAMGISSGTASAGKSGKTEGTYVSGDFHNHTTCSDGSISMQKLVKKATDKDDTPWGLDWFVQAGHGGNGNRNCTLVEDATLATPAYPVVFSTTGELQGPTTTWQNTNPPVQPKGAVNGTAPNQNMWRWQSLQEFQYPLLEYLSAFLNEPLFIGVESVVAGHEHSSMSVITGQMPKAIDFERLPRAPGYTPIGNASALAQWEYCFDRADADTSRGNTTTTSGVGNNWDCSNPASGASTDPTLGWSDAARKLIQPGGTGSGTKGHLKTVEAVKWMAEFHPKASYYVPAHLERAGPFNPNGNNGYNIESLRDFNNAAPNTAFGMETQPGHGASDARGEYTIRRNNIGGVNIDSVGGTTYGGTGVYGAQIGGVWDALLGEGRNFWFFASSDWHNRGIFGPDDRRSTQDFYPGEYQRTYAMVRPVDPRRRRHHFERMELRPQAIVDGLRSGNAFSTSGQLIDRLAFVACVGHGDEAESAAVDAARDNKDVDSDDCATMGDKLVVRPGADVTVAIVVRDPSGTNYSPYTFNNPSLAQVGIQQPLNKPVLDHVDVIRGMVTGYKVPGAADYSGQWPSDWITHPDLANVPAGAKNTTAAIIKTFNDRTWETGRHDRDYKVMTFRIPKVKSSQYIRLRGTNLPPSLPFETDGDGNPLADLATNAAAVNPTTSGGTDGMPANANLRIPCTVTGTNVPANGVTYTGTGIDGCPNHLPVKDGRKYVAYDVAAWSDLWFYSNPIYIEVYGSVQVAGVK